jgi:hypothetical protein
MNHFIEKLLTYDFVSGQPKDDKSSLRNRQDQQSLSR